MRRRTFIMVAAAIVAALALGFAVAPHLGWATPFSVPKQVNYRGVGFYLVDSRCLTPKDLPHGYLYEWRRRTIDEGTLLVEVRPGCLKFYVTADWG